MENFTGVRKIGQGIVIGILINVVTSFYFSCMSTLIPFDKSLQVISKLLPLALFPLKAHRFRTLDLIVYNMELYGNHCFGIETFDSSLKKFLVLLGKLSLMALLNFLLLLLPNYIKML